MAGSSAGRSHGRSAGTGKACDTDTTAGSNFRSQLQDEYDLEILDDGTTLNKGGGHSTTIMSTSIPATQHGRDSDSEELIQDRNYPLTPVHGHGHGRGDRGDTPPDSREDPFHIHTMTEFTVERHNV